MRSTSSGSTQQTTISAKLKRGLRMPVKSYAISPDWIRCLKTAPRLRVPCRPKLLLLTTASACLMAMATREYCGLMKTAGHYRVSTPPVCLAASACKPQEDIVWIVPPNGTSQSWTPSTELPWTLSLFNRRVRVPEPPDQRPASKKVIDVRCLRTHYSVRIISLVRTTFPRHRTLRLELAPFSFC